MAKKRDITTKPESKSSALKLKTNHLLVIGIDQYEDAAIPDLNNAVRDAQRFVEILHSDYQFKSANTIELYNEAATKDKILEAFDRYINSLGKEDNLVVYFSGHGELIEKLNRGYWIPTEARLEKRGDYLSNTDVLDFFRSLEVHHIFAIVDACFSGALARNIEKPSYNQRVDLKPSRWLLSSGALEKVSDGSGKHSPFANSLFSALIDTDRPEINVLELCTSVLATIDANTKDQTPIGQPLFGVGHMMGQFVFYRKGYLPKTVKTESSAPREKIPTRSVSEETTLERIAEEVDFIVESAPQSSPPQSSPPESTTIENSKNIITGGTITVGGDLIIGDGNNKEEEQEAIMDLGSGNLLYDIPDAMQLKKPSACKVRIASNRKILLQDIQTTTSAIIRDLHKITEVMSVELIDVSGGANFTILRGSSEEQSIDKEWYTEWTFYVTPLVIGKHTLLLRLSEIKLINNKERKRDITFTEIVEVATLIESEPMKPAKSTEKPSVSITSFGDLITHLKDLLGTDLELTLMSFRQILPEKSSIINEITLQLGSYNSANRDFAKGLRTVEQRDRTYARIRYAMTHMIDELTEEKVRPNFAAILNTAEKLAYKDAKGADLSLDLKQLEKAGLTDQANLLIKKLNFIKKARITETDAGKQFQYDTEIEDMENQLKVIKEQLG